MKKKTNLIFAVIFTVVSMLASLAFCGFRIGFVFVDHEVHFDGFCYLLWAIFIANTIALLFQLRSLLKKDRLINKPLFVVNGILSVLTLAAAIGFTCYRPAEIPNFIQVAPEILPYLGLLYAFLFFALVFPYCHRIFRSVTASVIAVCIIASAAAFLFPIGGFKIESAPAVFDDGNGYRVVFSTNRKSVGAVTYEYNGESYTVWDNTIGRKDASKVHSVSIPYEHLDNNKYSVKAVRSLEDIAYGGHLGKEISIDIDTFIPCPKDDFNMLCISDNHSAAVDWNLLKNKGDTVVFLGDVANGIYSYDSFVDNLIIPAGIITDGRKPVVFVCGNHDHRGNYVPELLKALNFDNYYYRIKTGNYTFTVFDSGEDKTDDNYEYGGYAAYEAYRNEQLEWAKNLAKEDGYNIVLAHAPTYFDCTEDDISQMSEYARNFGAKFIICGHKHTPGFTTAEESSVGVPYYIVGACDGQKDLRYTVIDFSKGELHMVSERLSDGEILCEATVNLEE